MDRTPSTKLTKVEKREVKAAIREFNEKGGAIFSMPDDRMTIAVMPIFEGSEFVHVAASFCALHEPKFRKTLGAKNVLFDMEYGNTIRVRRGNDSLEDVAINFANMNR